MKPVELKKHPEGGRFREVYRSGNTVSLKDGTIKSSVTHIYFSLKSGEVSRFHKVAADEIWNLYQGRGLNLYTWDGSLTPPLCTTLSASDNCYCHVIPAGIWQAAEPMAEEVLVGCSVAPGFEFSDFQLIDPTSKEAELFKRQKRFQKFLSDNHFGVYVFHTPILVAISVSLKMSTASFIKNQYYYSRRKKMKVRSIIVTIFLFFSLVFAGTGFAQESTPTDYDAVKMAIEQSIGWAIKKDFDAMFRLWDDNMFHFWLFSDSLVVGLDAFRVYAEQWKEPDFRGTRFEFKDLRITFSTSGDVAWYSCFLDDCGSYKGKESCLENVFQTGVLEKKNGRWLHVQMHGSYPVDKIPENYVRRFYSNLFEKKNPE